VKTSESILSVVFGFALLAALLISGYFMFKYVADMYSTLDPQTRTLVTIASIVSIVCAAIIAGGFKARSSAEDIALKAKVYELLAAFHVDQLKGTLTDGKERPDMIDLIKLEQLLSLHGSQKVITTHKQLRSAMQEGTKESNETSRLLNKLVQAMRADLGGEPNIKEKDVLELLVGQS